MNEIAYKEDSELYIIRQILSGHITDKRIRVSGSLGNMLSGQSFLVQG
jgi:hypothetical protein